MARALLHEFRIEFQEDFGMQLILNTDRAYWELHDHQSPETLDNLVECVNRCFEDFFERYRDTSAWDAIDTSRVAVVNAAWAAVNLPYPRDPDRFLHKVCDNIFDIIDVVIITDLVDPLEELEQSASLIQRTWRRAISDPARATCRRRLLEEFESLNI